LNSLEITAQRTRTRKKSNEPYDEQIKSWLLSIYSGANSGTLVVSLNESGPISLKHHGGQTGSKKESQAASGRPIAAQVA
jgi:hypothetical protein